jgi:hypothetical protein
MLTSLELEAKVDEQKIKMKAIAHLETDNRDR